MATSAEDLKRLFKAVRKGDLLKVKGFFDGKSEHFRIEQANKVFEECTLLIISIANGHYSIAEYLIKECGANVNQHGKDKKESEPNTPIRFACPNIQLMQLLITNSANVNEHAGTKGALFHACEIGHIEAAKFLLDNRATPTANCLFIACSNGYADIVELLIARGLDVNIVNDEWNALHFAIYHKRLEVIKVLLKYNITMMNHDGISPVLFAATTQFPEAIGELAMFFGIEQVIDAYEIYLAQSMTNGVLQASGDGINKAIEYWMAKAIEQRNLLALSRQKFKLEVFDNIEEVNSLEELKQVCSDKLSIVNHALTTMARVFGTAHPQLLFTIEKYAVLFIGKDDVKSVRLCNFCLDRSRDSEDRKTLKHYGYYFMIARAINSMIQQNNFTEGAMEAVMAFNKLIEDIEVANYERDSWDYNLRKAFHYGLIAILYYIDIFKKLEESADSQFSYPEYNDALAKLLSRDLRALNQKSLLHIACTEMNVRKAFLWHRMKKESVENLLPDMPHLKVIRTLVECGANVNDVDANGNNCLSLIAMCRPISDEINNIFGLLLDSGANPELRNKENLTPFEIFEKQATTSIASQLQKAQSIVDDEDSDSDGDDDSKFCHICMDKPINSALIECGHQCACFECASMIHREGGLCPICRAPIERVLKTFAT